MKWQDLEDDDSQNCWNRRVCAGELITNDDLAKIVDTNDEWIRTRTGIRERRISSGEGTRHLAAKAAELALAAAQELPRKSWISSFSGLRPRTGIIPAMPAVFRRPLGQ